MTTLVLVVLRDYQTFQLSTLLVASVGMQVAIIVAKPYEAPKANASALFNEVMVSVYLYLLFGIAYYRAVPDSVGSTLLGVIGSAFLVNLGLFLSEVA